MSSTTMLSGKFTARQALPPEGLTSTYDPALTAVRAYRSADEIEGPPAPGAPSGPIQSANDPRVLEAINQVGAGIASGIGKLLGQAPPPPATAPAQKAQNVTIFVVAGVGVLAVAAVAFVLLRR